MNSVITVHEARNTNRKKQKKMDKADISSLKIAHHEYANMTREQGPNESVHSFAGDLRRKCHHLKRSEHDLMERFVSGLRDPLLRYVMEKCPASFDDAVSHATAAESLQKFRGNSQSHE